MNWIHCFHQQALFPVSAKCCLVYSVDSMEAAREAEETVAEAADEDEDDRDFDEDFSADDGRFDEGEDFGNKAPPERLLTSSLWERNPTSSSLLDRLTIIIDDYSNFD